jgi:transposase InsO family protein
MMVDQFTKWVECIPLPSQSAEKTARAAVNQFFSRFGCPFQVFTDQGRNFESSLFREMCDLLHITYINRERSINVLRRTDK